MLHKHLALVSQSKSVSFSELTKVSAALQKQAVRDLGPIWQIQATVDPFVELHDIPVGYWPIIIMDKLPDPNALGYHEDQNNQPYSLVEFTENWSITASHEMLEMLVDPFGNRMVAGDSLIPEQGRVQYLVEVADPCESPQYAYSVNGIIVSDFYTPHFFEPIYNPANRYSYTGAIQKPRQILPGGYISWFDATSNEWWQQTFFGKEPVNKALPEMKALGGSLRSRVDRLTKVPSPSQSIQDLKMTNAVNMRKETAFRSDSAGGEHWKNELIRIRRPK